MSGIIATAWDVVRPLLGGPTRQEVEWEKFHIALLKNVEFALAITTFGTGCFGLYDSMYNQVNSSAHLNRLAYIMLGTLGLLACQIFAKSKEIYLHSWGVMDLPNQEVVYKV